MSDDSRDRGAKARERIDLHDPHEVDYWTQQLGCTEAKLREIVGRVGDSADTVRCYVYLEGKATVR